MLMHSVSGVYKKFTSREATEPDRLEIPLIGVVDDSSTGVRKASFSKKNDEGD